MDRLTSEIEAQNYLEIVDHCKKNDEVVPPDVVMYLKCYDVENFMAKWLLDSIEEMDKILTNCEKEYKRQEKELQSYKKMWKKLEKFIIKCKNETYSDNVEDTCIDIIDKMEELEKKVDGE